jgi:glycosyltransferase involved in cell wall biosynthesis
MLKTPTATPPMQPSSIDTPSRERRVLMIAHAFPPAGGSGVQRTAKFAKYLPQFGWLPTVFAAEAPADLPRDDSLLADLPADLDRIVWDRFDTSKWPRSAEQAMVRMTRWALGRRMAAGLGWRTRRLVERFVLHGLVPDASALWALSALPQLRRLERQRAFDVIYSTYSPASNHLLAWRISRATGIPWVADFRDVWTQDFRYPFRHGPRWRRALDRSLERRMIAHARAVVAVTEPQTQLLRELATDRLERFVTIPSGVDTADFARHCDSPGEGHCAERPDADVFRLSYVGRFCKGTIAPAFFEAVEALVRELGEDRERFELRLVGGVSSDLREGLIRCGVRCSETGYLPHADAIREMQAADALLLGIADGPNAETIMTGKVFEYLATGRPILAMGPENCVAMKLVESCRAGVVAPTRAPAIHAALRTLWKAWRSGEPIPGCAPEALAPHTRRNLTARLAALFEAVRTNRSPTEAVQGCVLGSVKDARRIAAIRPDRAPTGVP